MNSASTQRKKKVNIMMSCCVTRLTSALLLSFLSIFVIGDVEGQIVSLLKRLDKLAKKVPKIDYVFCVGDFLGNDSCEIKKCIEEQITVKYPIYFICPRNNVCKSLIPEENGRELCPNVIYLGNRGLFSSETGFKVAYFSQTNEAEGLNSGDIRHVLSQCHADETDFEGIDLLLTLDWPQDVTRHANLSTLPSPAVAQVKGSYVVAKLAEMLRPRYHFAASPNALYFERQAYRNHRVLQERSRHVTRFIGLGPLASKDQKSLTALQMTPMSHMEREALLKSPDDVTECPYVGIKPPQEDRRGRGPAHMVGSDQFFFDTSSNKRKFDSSNRDPNSNKQARVVVSPESCWFCLGNAKAERHLVVSVGEESYLALPKGGLHPRHVLILPIAHFASMRSAPPALLSEIDAYKRALRQYFSEKLNSDMVVFERNFKSDHLQLQVVPVPRDLSDTCARLFVEEAARSCGDILPLEEIPPRSRLNEIIEERRPYFHVELPGGRQLFARIDLRAADGNSGRRFDLQFGRKVLTLPELLNVPEKADWKACALSQEEEARMAREFRSAFAAYDIGA